MKKLFLQIACLGLLAILPCCPNGYGAEVDARVRAALALAAVRPPQTKKLDCACGASCTCTAGECGSPNCPSLRAKKEEAPGPIEWAVYLVQYNKAVSQNKPFLIWVGEVCRPCEAKWTEFVHAHLTDYDGELGPKVIVGKPDGLGGLSLVARLDGIPTKAQVDAALSLRRDDNPYIDNPHWPYQKSGNTTCVCPDGTICNCPGGVCPPQCISPQSFAPRPMPIMMPMMPPPMMMGGFGGGFGGGGGGGC